MKKRLLATLLALCLMFFLAPAAFAEENVAVDTKFSVDGYSYIVTSLDTSNPTVSFARPGESSTSNTYTGEINVPNTVTYNDVTYNVTGIAAGAFESSSVTKVILPDSIVTIGNNAFRFATSLTSVNIPSSVTVIADQTFSGCSALNELTISGDITKIGSAAFSGCSSLTTFSIPDSVTEIGPSAFSELGATSLSIPSGVTDGVVAALYGYTHLDGITFAEENPYQLVDGVLYKGTVLEALLDRHVTSVEILDGTTEIKASAFGSTPISGSATFNACTSLTTVSIPDTVETIGKEAFSGCSALKTADLPSGLKTIGEKAFMGTALETVVIPDGVTEIPTSVFSQVSTLKTIVIPSSVTSIGKNAFQALKNSDRGTTTTIIMQGTTAPSMDQAFGVKSNVGQPPVDVTVLVPAGSEDAYKKTILKTHVTTSDSGSETTKPGISYSLALDETASVEAGKTVTLTADSIVPDGCIVGMDKRC